jgi:hypothetical protein
LIGKRLIGRKPLVSESRNIYIGSSCPLRYSGAKAPHWCLTQ